MQLCDLPNIATSLDNVVVELVPESQSRQRWPRKSSKGIENTSGRELERRNMRRT